MPRGGKRDGAGRKPSTPNKATQERQRQIASTGATPLDVIIADMRFHHGAAEAEAAKGKHADASIVTRERAAAREAAKDAAPYVHPRLQATAITGANGGPLEYKEVSESRDALERKLARIAGADTAIGVSGKPN